MPPPDGGMMPPPDGGMMPPPDGGMRPPPDGGMHAPPDGGMRPPPDGGMMPPPDAGSSSGGGSDAGDGSGAVQPGIGVITGDGNGTYPPYSGNNVSIDDTTIVLGNSQTNCISGHASVYVWDGVSSWQVQQTFDDPASNGFVNCFGGSTAVLGDVAFVSAPQTTSYEGMVYEYTRSGTTWTEASSIADTSLTGDVALFGYSVAYDATHLIAGAPAVQSNGTTYIGRVDVLIKQGPDWNVQKEIYAPVQTGSACFGTSVAIDGTRLAVGANGGPQQAYSVAGAAYTYEVSGTTWSYEASAIGTDTQSTDGFGQSVALASATGSPDLLIVGAPAASSPVASQSGAAYAFYFDSSNDQWVQSTKLYASDAATGDRFGYTVGAISSTQVVVGSPNPSKAYLFTFSGGAWTQTTIYQSCPQTIGWNMATWGTLVVTGKANDVVIDTSLTNPSCGGN